MTADTKICNKCKENKPLSDFTARPDNTIQKVRGTCKSCEAQNLREWRRKNPDKHVAITRRWRLRYPEKAKVLNARAYQAMIAKHGRDHLRDQTLKQRFGLPIGDYDRLLAEQQGRCAICGTERAGGHGRFHVDHDHETKVIRGLLCTNCNRGLGHFQDSAEILYLAFQYLRAQEGQTIINLPYQPKAGE